jgi:hypothetical protein
VIRPSEDPGGCWRIRSRDSNCAMASPWLHRRDGGCGPPSGLRDLMAMIREQGAWDGAGSC